MWRPLTFFLRFHLRRGRGCSGVLARGMEAVGGTRCSVLDGGLRVLRNGRRLLLDLGPVGRGNLGANTISTGQHIRSRKVKKRILGFPRPLLVAIVARRMRKDGRKGNERAKSARKIVDDVVLVFGKVGVRVSRELQFNIGVLGMYRESKFLTHGLVAV